MSVIEKYPKDFQEFLLQLRTDDDCWKYLFEMRWLSGFLCPSTSCSHVDSLLKRWINGTHQGNVSHKHLSYYLDEFAFRIDRKLSTYREKLFYRPILQAVSVTPKPYGEIVNPST